MKILLLILVSLLLIECQGPRDDSDKSRDRGFDRPSRDFNRSGRGFDRPEGGFDGPRKGNLEKPYERRKNHGFGRDAKNKDRKNPGKVGDKKDSRKSNELQRRKIMSFQHGVTLGLRIGFMKIADKKNGRKDNGDKSNKRIKNMKDSSFKSGFEAGMKLAKENADLLTDDGKNVGDTDTTDRPQSGEATTDECSTETTDGSTEDSSTYKPSLDPSTTKSIAATTPASVVPPTSESVASTAKDSVHTATPESSTSTVSQ
uniref:DUF148 domain-containing protein n=1 Tax=Rhabditophanes sp. KR3021 TaxID=114890 RepID=A0AC35TT42_9BILA